MLPETSAPSPGAFQEAFLAAAADGYDGVLCINLSGGVSATYQAAVAAAKAVGDQIPVRTIDSRSLTMGLGPDGPRRRRHGRRRGRPSTSCAARVEKLIGRTQVFGVVDTLEHLEKGGRIGGARALLGSLLSIKPVVPLVDGVVEEESKQRTRAPVAPLPGRQGHRLGPDRAGWPCATARPPTSTTSSPCSTACRCRAPARGGRPRPVVGTHTGPGTIGLCIDRPLD